MELQQSLPTQVELLIDAGSTCRPAFRHSAPLAEFVHHFQSNAPNVLDRRIIGTMFSSKRKTSS